MVKHTRREVIKSLGIASVATMFMPTLLSFNINEIMKRIIPSSGEKLPVVGLGTWQTFDVGSDNNKREVLSKVLMQLKALGGSMIDSSPMYGSSEKVVGDLTQNLNIANDFFYATKVWTNGREEGISQMEASFKKMQRKQMDLMQIHNLVDWQTHVKTLRDWKASEKIRYWGFTHYTDSSHDVLAKLIKQEHPDFVQFNYNINNRHAEKSLLDIAKHEGVAVIINRPYDGGSLFRKTKGKELPDWTKEIDITSWGQYFLKYILSHEAVNCVIPGTSKPHHAKDNLGAGYGRTPTNKERQKMLAFLNSI